MRFRRQIISMTGWALALTGWTLRADSGDVENSHDYNGFSRPPGFVISDYDEDNPATFDFPVARPIPIDSGHIEMVHVAGHRYIIHYDLAPGGQALTVLQTQRYYEKLAAAAGFTAEKTGAVGDVSETFVQQQGNRFTWVYLEPAGNANSLTVMESSEAPPVETPPSTPPPPELAQSAAPAPAPPPVPVPTPDVTKPIPPATDNSEPAPEITHTDEDPLYATLMRDGHVRLPITFLPGKPDIDADSRPVIDRVVSILKLHPDLQIEIDGHTDNYGSTDENRYISTQRALTVKGLLIAGHINRRRLTAVGKGGSQPIADNETADGREQNRRIELVLRKSAAKKESSGDDSASGDSSSGENPAFHPAAPNGQNYYPGASSSSEADSAR